MIHPIRLRILAEIKDTGKTANEHSGDVERKEVLVSSDNWKVKCRVQRGMFDDEYLVIIEIIDDNGQKREAAAFVGKEEISVPSFPEGPEEVDGFLTVSPMEITTDKAFIVLPKSTLANGPVVSVNRSELVTGGGAVIS